MKTFFFPLFINKILKMEKNVIKTIREAFKIAYSNKLIKESSIKMAKELEKTDPNGFNKAEAMYPRWISGRLNNFKWGKGGSQAIENYLIEKAAEEYKQTKDKKIHDAIANFYYPDKNGLLYNYITNTSRYSNVIMGALRDAKKLNLLEDLLFNAWTQSIGDVSKFDEYITEYTTDSPYGIGSLLKNKLELEATRLSKKADRIRRGGEAGYEYLDQPGYDSEGGRKMDLPGGIEISDEAGLKENMYDLFAEFGNMASDFFESKGKESLATLAREFFVNGKSYAQILSDNPDLFANKIPGDLSTMMLVQVLAPSSIKSIAKAVAKEIGFPENWLENLITSKNISSIQDAFKEVEPETEAPVDVKKKGEDDLVFEKFINSNMDAIIQEVYKRLNESYFHDGEKAYIGRTDAYYADEYDGDVYEPEYWTYSTDINDKDFAEGGDLYQLTDEGKEIINSWLDSKEHNEYQRMNARRSGGLSSFANMDKEELWDYLTTDRRYSNLQKQNTKQI